MKKVIIFGATGTTGLCAMVKAVENGFKVTAFVRDESKIPPDIRKKVEVAVGDVITDPEQVSKAMCGKDAVVIALGTRNDIGPTTLFSESMKNIEAAMKEHKVEIVSICMSASLFRPPEQVPSVFRHLVADRKVQFERIKKSGLKWIAVLPPQITDSPSSKYVIKYDESPGRSISKFDLGAFLVESLSQPEHYQKVVGIANT